MWGIVLTVVARATAPSSRWNTAVETHLVCNNGSDLSKALNGAPVLLTMDGIVPFRRPVCMWLRAVRELMQ